MNWLKHAFAVDPPGPAEPTDAQRVPVDKICREIVPRHMTTPALLDAGVGFRFYEPRRVL